MELPIAEQAVEFFAAAALGAALGFLYDVMRLFRGRIRLRAVTLALDAVFWLAAAAAAFLFDMTVLGGELRVFAALGAALGAALYFLLLSRPVLGVGFHLLDLTGSLLGALLRPVAALCGEIAGIYNKMNKFEKNIFKLRRKRCMIDRHDRQMAGRRKKTARRMRPQ